jgi:hypothetical protein
MSKTSVLYFSKYCAHCQNILKILNKTTLKKDIHFLSIDKRVEKDNKTYLLLDDGNEILLPNKINRVPALLLLQFGNKLLFGTDILKFLRPQIDTERKEAVKIDGEPLAYSFGGEEGIGMSDNYSFLDQNSDELGVKGKGGLRQMHSYRTVDSYYKIDTPPEDYVKEKTSEDKIKQYRDVRNKDVEWQNKNQQLQL